MQLSPEDQGRLTRALETLAAGDHRRFADLLWLGFGDTWRPMLGLLARGGYVRLTGRDRMTASITPRGEKLIEQLRRATVAAGAA